MDATASASRPFPGFDHLYYFSWRSLDSFRGRLDWPKGLSPEEALRQWSGLLRAEVRPPTIVPVRHIGGSRTPGDVVFAQDGPLVLHRRVIDLLLDHELTGWTTYPVELYGKAGEFFPNYVGFAITGRCGPMDGMRSEEILKEYPGGMFPAWKGVYFAEDSWDGSDFFMFTEASLWINVTEDVVRAFKQAKVQDVRFDRLSEKELSWDPAGKSPAARPPWPPRKSPAPPRVTGAPYVEVALDEEARAETEELSRAARERLEIARAASPDEVVQALAAYIEDVRPLKGHRLLDEAVELGALFGEQFVRALGWEWVGLKKGEEQEMDSMAVVPDHRSVAILADQYVHDLLRGRARENNMLGLFRLVSSGRLPPAAPRSYLVLE